MQFLAQVTSSTTPTTPADNARQAAKTAQAAIEAGDWISAALVLILTAAVVVGARWVLRTRDPVRLATDPGTRTRIRLVQRMAISMIVVIGLSVALAMLGLLDGIANTILAGSAITAIIAGFAARQTLANSLAGIVLTITQPIRVGDQVRVGEHEGTVEDVTLSSTILRTVLGTTIRVPNDFITQNAVLNDTIDGKGVVPEATLWLPFGTDVAGALDVALDVPGVQLARLAQIEPAGWNKVIVRGDRCSPGDRVPAEARLRLSVLDALRSAGHTPPIEFAGAPDDGVGAQSGQEPGPGL